ncbi:sorting nexin-11 [Pempheris klunzingeri]|uniref:sorting nexin-11 n=1 Tax=Pempheris klunzingeri TaxID=3127111 RepID=UPI00397EC12E
MISNQEEDEFVAVRVQDPRIQNEGSWNSYVDYKIFLHTNSKAFTAKTSCVRRRYSEFVWLKRKLQKNSGLVPVPDLPGKSFFSFCNEDFLEGRRKGLQAFLDKVVNMTVCLSDSQLHLFLQTQLPVGHIQDCVQGHTPYSVTDAILTYASSNRGFAQAQEDDTIKEPSLTVSYESMESPAPHQPHTQTTETVSPELFSCGDSDPLDGLLDRVELQHEEKSSIKVLQRDNQLEAIVEDCSRTRATFFLADLQDEAESLSPSEQTQQRSCQIQTPVEVHSPMGTGFEENCGVDGVDTEEKAGAQTVPHADTEEPADQQESSGNSEPEKSVNSGVILDFKDSNAESQEDGLGDVCSEWQILEISEVNSPKQVGSTEGHSADVSRPEELKNSDGEKEPDDEKGDESERIEETPLEIREETLNMHCVPDVEGVGDEETVRQADQKQAEAEAGLIGTKDESDEDSHSLPSSNESIVKVSDEESACDEADDSIQAANGYMKTPPEVVTHWSEVENILGLQMNGCPVGKDDVSAQEDEDLQYMTDISDLSKSLDLSSALTGGDLTENSDFSILETSYTPGLADSKHTEQEAGDS